MMHYPDDDTTHLDAPRLVRFRGSRRDRHRDVQNRAALEQRREAYLIDNVRLVRAAQRRTRAS